MSISASSLSQSRINCFIRSASGCNPSLAAYSTCRDAHSLCFSIWWRLAGSGTLPAQPTHANLAAQ